MTIEDFTDYVAELSSRGYHVTLEVDPWGRWEIGLLGVDGFVGDHLHTTDLEEGLDWAVAHARTG